MKVGLLLVTMVVGVLPTAALANAREKYADCQTSSGLFQIERDPENMDYHLSFFPSGVLAGGPAFQVSRGWHQGIRNGSRTIRHIFFEKSKDLTIVFGNNQMIFKTSAYTNDGVPDEVIFGQERCNRPGTSARRS
jgi:hypothetical protein